jgi:hypothetical protein
MTDYNVYIVESGDEGIGTGGTRWFLLGALIVPVDLDLQTSTMVSRVKADFGHDDKWTLHWKKVKKDSQKIHITDQLLTEEWRFSAVVIDKTHPLITGVGGLKNKWYLYFYATRFLLERISWFAHDVGDNGVARLTFEHRSNMGYAALNNYFKQLQGRASSTQISWANVETEGYSIVSKTKNRLLQATDSILGTLSEALEPDGFGNIEPRYLLNLSDRFYRRRGNLFSYGLKFLPATKDSTAMADLQADYAWLNTI